MSTGTDYAVLDAGQVWQTPEGVANYRVLGVARLRPATAAERAAHEPVRTWWRGEVKRCRELRWDVEQREAER